ncbi:MAG: Rieske 2Fe-2S domain-containing protein, partial [Rhodococcus sp.]|nr:Rieske 2Fe-2S domain-containing protein [Rhodococcus sp. (in: high G+C Gram-positive bacteria)]
MTPEATTGVKVASLSDLADNAPFATAAAGVDLVIIRRGEHVSALYGRCAHRGALLGDGHVDGNLVVCDVHGWRYDVDTGVSPVNPAVALATFPVWVRNGGVYVDQTAIAEFAAANAQSYGDDGYQG